MLLHLHGAFLDGLRILNRSRISVLLCDGDIEFSSNRADSIERRAKRARSCSLSIPFRDVHRGKLLQLCEGTFPAKRHGQLTLTVSKNLETTLLPVF